MSARFELPAPDERRVIVGRITDSMSAGRWGEDTVRQAVRQYQDQLIKEVLAIQNDYAPRTVPHGAVGRVIDMLREQRFTT